MNILLGRQSTDVNKDEFVSEAERFTEGHAAIGGMKELDVDAAPPDLDVGDPHVQQILTSGLRGRVRPLTATMKSGEVSGHGRMQPRHSVRMRITSKIRVIRCDDRHT